jgi:hypothetical protein
MVTIKIKQQALMVELASEDLKKKNKKQDGREMQQRPVFSSVYWYCLIYI